MNVLISEMWRYGEYRQNACPTPFTFTACRFRYSASPAGRPPRPTGAGKDTVVVPPKTVVEVILRFDHAASDEYPFMYHCHMLEHEEGGMMGQFTVSE
jgi:blue copper oxidase